jgi:hypothetical protein
MDLSTYPSGVCVCPEIRAMDVSNPAQPGSMNRTPRNSLTKRKSSSDGHKVLEDSSSEEPLPGDFKGTRKTSFNGWLASRSKLFWVLIGSILASIVVVTVVPTVLLARPYAIVTDPPTLTNIISHSFMVDIRSDPDDNTRAAVSLVETLLRIDSKTSYRSN